MKDKNLIYWDSEKEELVGSVTNKIKKLFKLHLIEKVSDNSYLIHPIPKYNITTYKIMGSTCTCQGYHKYKRCSHLEAVRIYKSLFENNLNQAEKQMLLNEVLK